MTFDEIERTFRDLRTDLDQARRDIAKAQHDHDQLSGKLRYPGTKFLVDLEYKLVYDATLTAAGTPATTVQTLGPVFETLPGLLHAVYELSAYAPGSNVPVITSHGGGGTPASVIQVRLERARQTGPTRTEIRVAMQNTIGTDYAVAVRVWRRLGMGS
jgi:hypothetical protein